MILKCVYLLAEHQKHINLNSSPFGWDGYVATTILICVDRRRSSRAVVEEQKISAPCDYILHPFIHIFRFQSHARLFVFISAKYDRQIDSTAYKYSWWHSSVDLSQTIKRHKYTLENSNFCYCCRLTWQAHVAAAYAKRATRKLKILSSWT